MGAKISEQALVEARQCIVLMCDEDYLFPSLVSAKQARANAPASADVVIFLETDHLDPDRKRIFEAASGAIVRTIPDWLLSLLTRSVPEGFFKTHVSRAALFRMFVGRALEQENYERILYIDGDTQVRASLSELLTMPLAEGTVGAVPDWMALHSTDGMPGVEAIRQYFTGLGLSPGQWSSYFNSGVMVASPATWNDIGPKALEFLIAKPDVCKWHDQSALNYACREQIKSVSFRWNFLRSFMTLPAYKSIDPAIIHFVGRLKPWDGAYAPWSNAEFQPYVEMDAALRGTGLAWKRKPMHERLAYRFKPLFRNDELKGSVYSQRVDNLIRERS
jgi:lipopolysaccharide biosynthesis glycosyltransferase